MPRLIAASAALDLSQVEQALTNEHGLDTTTVVGVLVQGPRADLRLYCDETLACDHCGRVDRRRLQDLAPTGTHDRARLTVLSFMFSTCSGVHDADLSQLESRSATEPSTVRIEATD